MILIFRIQNY